MSENREYVSRSDELGNIHISGEVLASIAAAAALEVEGVSGLSANLGSDIAMAFDECVENPATYEYAKASCERTARWLERCKAEHDRLNALPDTVNPGQMLFGINQGATYEDLRVWHMQQIAKIDCDGFAIKEGDYLALEEGKLFDTDGSLDTLLHKLAEDAAGREASFISLYFGEDVQEADAQKAGALFEEVCPGAEVAVLSGGQPVYYYIISME